MICVWKSKIWSPLSSSQNFHTFLKETLNYKVPLLSNKHNLGIHDFEILIF